MKRTYEILDIQFDDVLNYVQILIDRGYSWRHINSAIEVANRLLPYPLFIEYDEAGKKCYYVELPDGQTPEGQRFMKDSKNVALKRVNPPDYGRESQKIFD